MEEDIKILEKYIDEKEGALKIWQIETINECEDLRVAIENLIQRFKVLKAEYKREQYRNELLENKNTSLKKEINLMKSLDIPNTMIPKSKVKEKIEEWDESIKWANADDRYYAIKILKELLED